MKKVVFSSSTVAFSNANEHKIYVAFDKTLGWVQILSSKNKDQKDNCHKTWFLVFLNNKDQNINLNIENKFYNLKDCLKYYMMTFDFYEFNTFEDFMGNYENIKRINYENCN